MELKSSWYLQRYHQYSCSNCTFMELKSDRPANSRAAPRVLIVPLWNWNRYAELKSARDYFVLIVPLWNWNLPTIAMLRFCNGSNCTFMELKWSDLVPSKTQTFVLIVPLWNWNMSNLSSLTVPDHVLIVPLWNWNDGVAALLSPWAMF